jgi:hypothetical protein
LNDHQKFCLSVPQGKLEDVVGNAAAADDDYDIT